MTMQLEQPVQERQPGYSSKWIAFVRQPMHAEAFLAAYYDQSTASRNELLRLHWEWTHLPDGQHICTCWCPNESRGWKACNECFRIRAWINSQPIPEEMGHSSHVEAPMPLVLELDLMRAMSVLGPRSSASRIARYLNGEVA